MGLPRNKIVKKGVTFYDKSIYKSYENIDKQISDIENDVEYYLSHFNRNYYSSFINILSSEMIK